MSVSRVASSAARAARRSPSHHADVRRMLMDMKSRTEAGRALAYYVAGCMDRAKSHPDADVRAANQRRLELLTPVVKG